MVSMKVGSFKERLIVALSIFNISPYLSFLIVNLSFYSGVGQSSTEVNLEVSASY